MTRAADVTTPSEQPLTLAHTPDDAALLEQVLQHYQAALKEGLEVTAYLQKRGLDDPLLIEHFRLGLANRTLGYRLPQANRRAGAELRGRLQQLGVLRESGHEHLWGSLVIPVLGADGAILQMYGRKITEGLRKGTPLHVYLSGSRNVVFNEQGLHGSEDIILCRSLIDALTFWRHGLRHVTALLEERAGPVLRQRLGQARRVLIAFRRDDAGEDATAALVEALAGRGVAVYRVRLPQGLDVNEYARTIDDPAAALTRLVRNAEWLKGGDGPGVTAPASSPLPALSRPVAAAQVNAHDVIIRLGARIWRMRGLAKNTNVDALKVVLEVRPAIPGAEHGDGEAFHIHGLDLLNAKSRNTFAAQAAAELGVSLDVIKREIGQVIFALEDVRDAAIKSAEAEQVEPPVQLSPEDEQAALAFLRSPDLMTRIASDRETVGIVGEGANAQAAYLAGLSRKLDRPLALLIQFTSAAGKSALMDAVLDLIPEEERVVYSAMTGQSLYYLGETNLKHKALAIAEGEGAKHASYALKLLQSQGTLTMASTGKDPASGKLVTQEYRVEGPVALMLTCLVLTIDEGRDQTRAIQARQRFEETLEGLEASARRASVIKLH
jgi:DNA primase